DVSARPAEYRLSKNNKNEGTSQMSDSHDHSDTTRTGAVTRRKALAVASGAAIALAANRTARAQGSPKKGGTLRVSSASNPSSLDPTTGGSGADHTFLY